MDKHTLKIKSKTITTWIRDFYDSFSPWYFGFNSTNDSFEINSMIGTQPKWGMYLDSLEDELRLLSDGNYKRVFDEVIEFVLVSAWGFNPCSVHIESDLIEAISIQSTDPAQYKNLVGCPVFYAFEKPRIFLGQEKCEGFFAGVIPSKAGSIYIVIYPVENHSDKISKVMVRLPRNVSEWERCLKSLVYPPDSEEALRILAILSSSKLQSSEWRRNHIRRARLLREQKSLFSEKLPDRDVDCTIFNSASIDNGDKTIDQPANILTLNRFDFSGDNSLIRIPEDCLKDMKMYIHWYMSRFTSLLLDDSSQFFANQVISSKEILELINQEQNQHPNQLTAHLFSRAFNLLSRINWGWNQDFEFPKPKGFDEHFEILFALLSTFSRNQASYLAKLSGRIMSDSNIYLYYKDWHIRNNEESIMSDSSDVSVEMRTIENLYVSVSHIFWDLANDSNVSSRECFYNLIFILSYIAASVEVRKSVSILRLTYLYKILLSCKNVKEPSKLYLNRIKRWIGQVLLDYQNEKQDVVLSWPVKHRFCSEDYFDHSMETYRASERWFNSKKTLFPCVGFHPWNNSGL